jgi:hypothetical protein
LSLCYEDERKAKAVAKAVSPDNIKTPSGLFIHTEREGCKVLTYVKCEMQLQTLIATLDDLLSCVSVAEKAIVAVEV